MFYVDKIYNRFSGRLVPSGYVVRGPHGGMIGQSIFRCPVMAMNYAAKLSGMIPRPIPNN